FANVTAQHLAHCGADLFFVKRSKKIRERANAHRGTALQFVRGKRKRSPSRARRIARHCASPHVECVLSAMPDAKECMRAHARESSRLRLKCSMRKRRKLPTNQC